MLRVALIRAGSSDFDLQERVQGRLPMPLSAEGAAADERLAAELRIPQAAGACRSPAAVDWVYAAPFLGAKQTAERLASVVGRKVRLLPGLEEVHVGLWAGCRWEEIRQKHPRAYRLWEEGCDHVCPPAGETLSEARERARKAISALFRKHPHGTMLLVVPRLLYRVVEQLLREAAAEGRCELLASCTEAARPPRPIPAAAVAAVPVRAGVPVAGGFRWGDWMASWALLGAGLR